MNQFFLIRFVVFVVILLLDWISLAMKFQLNLFNKCICKFINCNIICLCNIVWVLFLLKYWQSTAPLHELCKALFFSEDSWLVCDYYNSVKKIRKEEEKRPFCVYFIFILYWICFHLFIIVFLFFCSVAYIRPNCKFIHFKSYFTSVYL